MKLARTPQEAITLKYVFIAIAYWGFIKLLNLAVHFAFSGELQWNGPFDIWCIILAAIMAGRGAVNEAYSASHPLGSRLTT